MDNNLKKILWISGVVLVFGGFGALINLWSGVVQIFFAFFPIFGKQIIENYFTSPYFITGVIMAIASGFGIWFGAKGGKTLFLVVSIICEIASLTSMGLNIF